MAIARVCKERSKRVNQNYESPEPHKKTAAGAEQPKSEPMIPKHRFDTVNNSLKATKERQAELMRENAELREAAIAAESEKLAAGAGFENSILALKIEAGLLEAGAKSAKAAAALLDLKKLKLGPCGEVSGLGGQIAELKKSHGYLFSPRDSAYLLIPASDEAFAAAIWRFLKTTGEARQASAAQPGKTGKIKAGEQV
jgi:hypothetical protein